MWYNPIITFILRSPFHFLVSGMYLLITFTGRKSGRTYTTPVQFKQEGRTLKFVTRRGRAWWRNLNGGAPVSVRVRGRTQTGTASVLPGDDAALAAEIETIYAPMVSAEQAARLAPDSVVVQVELA
jgi:deazaflavin-dependent oxidoreductase (nitroreductase family)